MCHRLSAGHARGPRLLASQPGLFGELQASGGLLLKINKEKNHRNLGLLPGFNVPGMWLSGRVGARHGQKSWVPSSTPYKLGMMGVCL